MLTIDLEGAQALLNLLRRAHEGHPAGETELEEVLAANAFFVDFYSRWEGSDRETIRSTIRHFDRPELVPSGMLPARLAEGFRQAVGEMDLLESRMSWLGEVDTSEIAGRVLAFLPAGTPLDSVIHVTVDLFNNGFVHRREMGVSLLKGMADRETFEDTVAHELHHVCFRFWSERDAVRQALLQERSGRAVAMSHVQNLLSEGMANYYLTPGYVFRQSPQEPPADPFQARLARLQREEGELFALAEAILATSLEPGAGYEPCREAFEALALDMEEALLPAGHYLGARLVETMAQVHPRDLIVRCVEHLPEFLPSYNQAAQEVGTPVFDPQLVDRFTRLWDTDAADRKFKE
jgi:hypothetical protein